jgi:hypothetical protein
MPGVVKPDARFASKARDTLDSAYLVAMITNVNLLLKASNRSQYSAV